MLKRHKPVVDNWYRDNEGRYLTVIEFDEDEELIEVQYYDGEVEELDLETWFQLEAEPGAAPEDFCGAFDELEPDDRGDSELSARGANEWRDPMDELDRED